LLRLYVKTKKLTCGMTLQIGDCFVPRNDAGGGNTLKRKN
jgi:hypothetical protein